MSDLGDRPYQLVHVSTAVVGLDDRELEAVLGPGRERNRAAGVTGLLVHVRGAGAPGSSSTWGARARRSSRPSSTSASTNCTLP